MKKFLLLVLFNSILFSQEKMKPKETEVWEPEPKVVTPGILSAPPSDAIILFDGTDFSKWQHQGSKKTVQWTLNSDKSMTVKPRTGSIHTIEEHGSIQLHLEWKTPSLIKGEGQGRGNSGIHVEKTRDVAFAPVPLGDDDCNQLLKKLKGSVLLDADNYDVPALIDLMTSLSNFAESTDDYIGEIDLNPVLVHSKGQGVTVIDALMFKHQQE